MRNLRKLRHHLNANPGDAEAHWRNGCRLAYLGHWHDAWPELEWRMIGHRPSIEKRKSYGKLDWHGEDGKVLVYQDQGHGDFIMWMRYIQRIPQVVLEAEAELVRLLRFNGYETHVKNDPLPNYDYVIPCSSLPSRFDDTFSPHEYLHNPKSGKFGFSGKKRIGVAWAGNPSHPDDKIRSANPDVFLGLSGDNRELISLMVSVSDNRYNDMSLKLVDFADTAEVIKECDVVVSVDTAVAHLAGTLGKEVHLVLATKSDWRWGEGDKSIWYPTMKIWRQKTAGDWAEVINRISAVI